MLRTQSRSYCSKLVLWLRDALISSSCTQSVRHLLVTSLLRLLRRPRAGRLQRGFVSRTDGEQHETVGTVQAHGQALLFPPPIFLFGAQVNCLERKSGMTTVPDMINTIVSWRLDHWLKMFVFISPLVQEHRIVLEKWKTPTLCSKIKNRNKNIPHTPKKRKKSCWHENLCEFFFFSTDALCFFVLLFALQSATGEGDGLDCSCS